MAESIHASACHDPADGRVAAHAGASGNAARTDPKFSFGSAAEHLRAAVTPADDASAKTNRERYLGAARIIQIYNSIERAFAGNGGAPALAQANAMAKAQAWDAWIASGEAPLKGLRGIPGGILSLAALERLSPGFSRWLDEPCGTDGALR